MTGKTRNEFAFYGLEILKRAVLLVLYEETDRVPVHDGSIKYDGSHQFGPGRMIKAAKVRERLGIPLPDHLSVNPNSLIRGVLDHLRQDGHAHHYVSDEAWGITKEGALVIDGKQ